MGMVAAPREGPPPRQPGCADCPWEKKGAESSLAFFAYLTTWPRSEECARLTMDSMRTVQWLCVSGTAAARAARVRARETTVSRDVGFERRRESEFVGVGVPSAHRGQRAHSVQRKYLGKNLG